MIKLIKLELQRINLRPYLISSAVFCIVLSAFTYFIAYVAQVEQEPQFMNYTNIFLFTNTISILLFGILSATMYARLIIEEYSGKRLALLFSYPVSRKKIFAAKVLTVFCFVLIAALLCKGISTILFIITESFQPIVSDTMSVGLWKEVLQMNAVSITAVCTTGLLALRIGFIKKSVSATLISAFILSAFYGNITAGSAHNPILTISVVVVSLAAVVLVLFTLSDNINRMEVE